MLFPIRPCLATTSSNRLLSFQKARSRYHPPATAGGAQVLVHLHPGVCCTVGSRRIDVPAQDRRPASSTRKEGEWSATFSGRAGIFILFPLLVDAKLVVHRNFSRPPCCLHGSSCFSPPLTHPLPSPPLRASRCAESNELTPRWAFLVLSHTLFRTFATVRRTFTLILNFTHTDQHFAVSGSCCGVPLQADPTQPDQLPTQPKPVVQATRRCEHS